MDNPTFVEEEDIPMVHQDGDYDDYNTSDTGRVDETSFTVLDTTEVTSTLRLRQKVKRDKLIALYRHLNVTGNMDLIDPDQFEFTMSPKKGVAVFEFYNGDWWVPLTKQTGDIFAPKILRDKLGELNTMKTFLGIDETPPALEKSFKAVIKLNREFPLKELSSSVDGIHVKTHEASQNIDLDLF